MAEYEAKQVIVIECPSPDCPTPGKVTRNGTRNGTQRYECHGCGKFFSADGKAHRKQYTANQTASAIDQYYSGMSYKQVAEHMEDVFDVPEPSKASVHSWVKGYTELAKDFLRGKVGEDGTKATASGKRVLANVGGDWVADEMVVKVGGQKFWNWNVMDKDTKYILAARLSRTRGQKDARAVFAEAKRNAARDPDTITTDGLSHYFEGIKAVFPKAKHIVSQGVYEPVNNNISERLQGSFRQRIKTQRGLQARRTAQDYLDGWVIDYNFMKKHHSLRGKTPADVAGVASEVPWDSWEDITRMGGEVAEPEVKEHITTDKKPGPKPNAAVVRNAVSEYMEAREARKARARRAERGRRTVAEYKPRARAKTNRRGRGTREMEATRRR